MLRAVVLCALVMWTSCSSGEGAEGLDLKGGTAEVATGSDGASRPQDHRGAKDWQGVPDAVTDTGGQPGDAGVQPADTPSPPPDLAGCIPSCGTKVCGSDGCAGTCGTCKTGELCLESGICVSTPGDPSPGALVITEIMVNPYSVPDSDGEWFEIRNTTPGSLGLHQLTIRDNDDNDFTVDKIVQVGPGEHFVFGRNWDPNKNGGAGVNYQWTGFTLSNTQDEIILEFKGFEVDRVEWFEPIWSMPVGAAMSLPPAKQNAADNNIADHWCPASGTIAGPGTDLGSPGQENPDCVGCFPACEGKECGPNGCGGLCGQCGVGLVCKQGSCVESPGDEPEEGELLVNEFLPNPQGVKDDDGEWIELLNVSDKTLVLKDMVVRDDGSDSFTIDQEIVVEPYDLVVLGKNGDKATNGGVTVDYVYSGFNLANKDDEIILEYNGSLVDEVKYDEDLGWNLQDGAAMGLDPWVADYELNDLPDAWCPATAPLASGDTGSPGEENEVCPF